MKRSRIWIGCLALAWLGPLGGARAQDGEADAPEVVVEPWRITARISYLDFREVHDALQHRCDSDNDAWENWRDGSSEGDGVSAEVAVGRGSGAFHLTVASSSSDYEYVPPEGNGSHRIRTDRADLLASWRETKDVGERRTWGWSLGFRYSDAEADIAIREGSAALDQSDSVTWHLVTGGYFGEFRPFKEDVLRATARVDFMLGEVSGLAREGNDAQYDGKITDTYRGQEYSLAYGLNAFVGLLWEIVKGNTLSLGYTREWMYSFDSTEEGTIVFPDNSDALFIQNSEALILAFGHQF